MTEHDAFELKQLDVLDWRVFEHYSRLQPDGAIYVITGRGYVFTAADRSGHDIRLAEYGGSLNYWKARVALGRTPIGGLGKVVRIVSANRRISSPEDYKAVRGHAPSKHEQPAWVTLTSLDGGAANDPAELYFLVRKPGTARPSLYWGMWQNDDRMILHQLRDDANRALGRPMLTPLGFAYAVNGELITQLVTPQGEGRPRSIGTLLAVIKYPGHLSNNDAHQALIEAWKARVNSRPPG